MKHAFFIIPLWTPGHYTLCVSYANLVPIVYITRHEDKHSFNILLGCVSYQHIIN